MLGSYRAVMIENMIYKFFIAAFLFFIMIPYSWAHSPEKCKPGKTAGLEELKENKNQPKNSDKNSQNEIKSNEIKPENPPSSAILAILINEFMPDPEGNDDENEWIEIKNPFETEVILNGWKIDDSEGGSKPFLLDGLRIGRESFLLLKSPQTKITLNNGSDTVRLFAYDGRIIDQISYEKPETGKSFARTKENTWVKNEKPTPGNENALNENALEEAKGAGTKASEESGLAGPEPNKLLKNEPPKGDLSDEIEISEILPNPAGPEKGHEWIELHNNSDETVNLSGWKIATKTKKFTIPENFIIQPDGYMTLDFEDIRLTLKNNGNEIYLLDPEENEIDAIEYEKAPENISFSKISIAKAPEKSLIPIAGAKSEEEQKWEWIEETTKGKANPYYYEIEGTVASGIEKNHFLFKSQNETIQVEFDPEKINESLLAMATKEGTGMKILAKKREKNQFELKTLEIMKMEKNSDAKNKIAEEEKKSHWLEASIILVTLMAGGGYFLYRYMTKLAP